VPATVTRTSPRDVGNSARFRSPGDYPEACYQHPGASGPVDNVALLTTETIPVSPTCAPAELTRITRTLLSRPYSEKHSNERIVDLRRPFRPRIRPGKGPYVPALSDYTGRLRLAVRRNRTPRPIAVSQGSPLTKFLTTTASFLRCSGCLCPRSA
jgi:hypothetical protein